MVPSIRGVQEVTSDDNPQEPLITTVQVARGNTSTASGLFVLRCTALLIVQCYQPHSKSEYGMLGANWSLFVVMRQLLLVCQQR